MEYNVSRNLIQKKDCFGAKEIRFTSFSGKMKVSRNPLYRIKFLRKFFGIEKEEIGNKVFFVSKKQIEAFKKENRIHEKGLDLNKILKNAFKSMKGELVDKMTDNQMMAASKILLNRDGGKKAREELHEELGKPEEGVIENLRKEKRVKDMGKRLEPMDIEDSPKKKKPRSDLPPPWMRK